MAIAIGVLDLELSGRADGIHRERIRAAAKRHGHTLHSIFEISPATFMPVTATVGALHKAAATVVIAPHVDHVWTARRALTEQATVLVLDPEQIWEHRRRWPSLAPTPPIHPLLP
ncbi:hypothetical protein [Nocardia gipuzkoensis]|uniref:hypothetical protein n=1 Tax=Nocardia gipuzkoensis TaxID=2749991 RepID=UPI00237D396C|nr:hypothetical protein [Nocardia gipuzkoensis]MDE1673836.1 hypothetical protein [Nocardia gipuzkoensis]